MIKLLKKIDKKSWLLMLVAVIFIVLQVWLDLRLPDYMSGITREIQTESGSMNIILKNGGYMLLCAFGSLFFAVITCFLTSKISANYSMETRSEIFRKVESLPKEEVKRFSISSLITRTTNDITQIEMFIAMGLQLLIKAPITAIWAITKILNKNINWSILTGGAVIILLIVIGIIIKIVIPRFKIVQKLIDKLNSVTRENLTGIRVVRAFNAERREEAKFKKANNDLTSLQLFNQKVFSLFSPIMSLVMYSLTLSIYFVGAYLINDADFFTKFTLFSDMIVFSSYAMQVIMSFLMLAMIFMILPRAQVSANRINEVLDAINTIKEGDKSGKTKESGIIEFRNVSFKYQDAEEEMLSNISFKVNKGETVAIIGSTGSGKSTLINLIPRFYDVTDGQILVDNIDVRDYKKNALNDKIGFVTQKAIIFKDSVKNNVSYGNKKISKTAVLEALKVAQAENFVEKLEDGINTELAFNGTNISGGQKQRISIARAIAKKPEIYIFDDTFSALDYKTDSILRKELKKYTKDSTNIIVAQRIGTIMNSDKIIVLDSGKCVGMGTHKELLKNCDVYKEIAYSQLSKEELENA